MSADPGPGRPDPVGPTFAGKGRPAPRLQRRPVIPEGPPADVPVRTLLVWVPDWPLVAAGVSPDRPAATFVANRVIACTPAARAADVRRHMRRREAQARCPSLLVLDHDPDRDARSFATVLHAIDTLTPRVEVTTPGRCAFPTRGPARYFGGDQELGRRAVEVVAEALRAGGGRTVDVRVGVADGPFAAEAAARAAHRRALAGDEPVFVVDPGGSPTFLAPMALSVLDRPDLVDVLTRLGLSTLGDLAALPATDVLGRFGTDGATAHRLASGLDLRPPDTEPPPPDLFVSLELDPPAERVEPVAFVARGLAEELHRRLDSRGSACTRVVIGAETEAGERSERVWRHEGALSAGAIADRIRWQIDGWLTGRSHRPTSGVVKVWLQPDEVVAADGRQLGFWGGDAAAAERATRAIARVQGLLGPDAVLVPEYQGGREPGEQLRLVPAGAVDLTVDRPSARPGWIDAPWPGLLPNPSPATVHDDPVGIEVVDAGGVTVAVDGRCQLTAAPDTLRIPGAKGWRTVRVAGWAGPWPVDERWWDPHRHRRRARFQIVGTDGIARLVVLESGTWTLEAVYD